MVLPESLLEAVHRLDELVPPEPRPELNVQVEQEVFGTQVQGEGRAGAGGGRVGFHQFAAAPDRLRVGLSPTSSVLLSSAGRIALAARTRPTGIEAMPSG
ncbi:MAG TPA: hypothetical protein VFF52_22090 [Isosphaeraceae bacterium]|nr:hypothetical protein [Isosphaeraceae bacterium]